MMVTCTWGDHLHMTFTCTLRGVNALHNYIYIYTYAYIHIDRSIDGHRAITCTWRSPAHGVITCTWRHLHMRRGEWSTYLYIYIYIRIYTYVYASTWIYTWILIDRLTGTVTCTWNGHLHMSGHLHMRTAGMHVDTCTWSGHLHMWWSPAYGGHLYMGRCQRSSHIYKYMYVYTYL